MGWAVCVAWLCLASCSSSAKSPTTLGPPKQLWLTQVTGSGAEVFLGLAPTTDGVWSSGHTDGTVGAASKGGQDMLAVGLSAVGAAGAIVQDGSADADSLLGAAAAPDDGVYVVGYTKGDYVHPNAGINDVVVARYAKDGSMIWSQQLGGPDWDRGFAVASFDGGLYVSGYTFGGLALANGAPNGAGGHDAFVARYTDDGTLEWIRQYGSDGVDWGQGIAVTADGGAVFTGYTQASYGGAYLGARDAFVTKISPTGEQEWVKQFGTQEDDWTQGIAVAKDGTIVVVGLTKGVLSPDAGAAVIGGADAVVIALSPTGATKWIRQFGSTADDKIFNVVIGTDDTIYLSGTTQGAMTQEPAFGAKDAFIGALRPDGTQLWLEQIGSPADDEAYDIDLSPDGKTLYVNGATTGALGQAVVGPSDGWIAAYALTR